MKIRAREREGRWNSDVSRKRGKEGVRDLVLLMVRRRRVRVCPCMSRIRCGILSVSCWVDLLVDTECISLQGSVDVSCSLYSCALSNILLILAREVQSCSLFSSRIS